MVYLYLIGFMVVYWGIFWTAALWDIKREKPINLTTDDILIPLLLIWIVLSGAIVYLT